MAEESQIARLVRQYGQGTTPAELTLDTPEKQEAYLQRMEAATREGFERDRRARAASWLAAKKRIVF